MNPTELFLDVSSGRFLDGVSTIPTAKPNFYGDEKRSVRLNVLKVRGNSVTKVTPAADARYKMRLGTSSLKLADATDTPTASPVLLTAKGAIVTAPASQATGSGVVFTYTPVTAQFDAIVSTESAVTAVFLAKITRVNPVTAAITAGISPLIVVSTSTLSRTLTLPAKTSENPLSEILTIERMPGALRTLTLTAQLNSPSPALFSTTASGGTVTTISITARGAGYPNGNYALTFSGASTAGTITASAYAVASGGIITSVVLDDGGSGYSGAPSASLFTPDKQISSIIPSNSWGFSEGKRRFLWAQGSTSVSLPNVPVRFSNIDTSSTVTLTSVPSAFLVHIQEDQWEVNIISNGYGYINTPTVTHDSAIVGAPEIVCDDSNGVRTTIDLSKTMVVENGGVVQSLQGVSLNFEELFNAIKNERTAPGQEFVPFFARIGFPSGNFPVRGSPILRFEQTEPLLPSLGSMQFAPAVQYSPELFSNISNQQAFIVGYGNKTGSLASSTARFPLWAIETPRQKNEFFNLAVVGQPPNDPRSFFVVPNRVTASEIQKGGIFGARIRMVDGGNINANLISSFDTIKNIDAGTKLTESPVALTASVQTAGPEYYQTILSSLPVVATRPGISFTEYFIHSGGFGWVDNPKINLITYEPPSTTTNGGMVVTASLTNTPRPYIDGEYDCTVQAPSVGTAARIVFKSSGGRGSVIVLDGGSGYTSAPIVTAPDPNAPNGIINGLVLKNNPVGYINNAPYKLDISASPITGGSAQVAIRFFTSTETEIKDFSLDRVPIGTQQIQVGGRATRLSYSPPLPSGFKIASRQVLSNVWESLGRNNSRQTIISRVVALNYSLDVPGFGYATTPVVTAPTPDSLDIGRIVGFSLKNSPQGYIRGKEYDLEIEPSPSVGGSARASFSVSDTGAILTSIENAGFGYTSKPVVTALGPDAKQGIITSVKTSSAGKGYGPGSYKCAVADAPSGGETASVVLEVAPDGSTNFVVQSGGYGYVSAPTVTAPLQPGNVIESITITCQGNYYEAQTATIKIKDGSGTGAVINSPLILSGKINNVQVLNKGYGYSDSPVIEFGAPTEPAQSEIAAFQVEGDFNITAASANAILTTANQRDITLEVYETDGTNEQVVAQATVNLSKRVLE